MSYMIIDRIIVTNIVRLAVVAVFVNLDAIVIVIMIITKITAMIMIIMIRISMITEKLPWS